MRLKEPENGNFKVFCGGMLLWYFMSGVEYGWVKIYNFKKFIVIPRITLANINDYLLHLGAAQKSIGYAFTFFAFAGLITSPIYG